MKALSIRAPWWWFILHAGKDVENRDWPTKFRGTVYVHASKWWAWHEVLECIVFALNCCGLQRSRIAAMIKLDDLKSFGGSLVGTVDIVDCVERSASPWFFGKYGFVLENPVVFECPIPCRGALGFFEVPDNLAIEHRGPER